MIFFALVAVITLAVALAGRFVAPGLAEWRAAMRWGLALALIFTGIDHLATPQRYLPMMPRFVPLHYEVVIFTGLCEIAGACGILVPRLRHLAGMMLAIYFVAVFPANIKNAVEGLTVAGLPQAPWYYWVRLPFQPLAVWWALYATGWIAWPRIAARFQPRRQHKR